MQVCGTIHMVHVSDLMGIIHSTDVIVQRGNDVIIQKGNDVIVLQLVRLMLGIVMSIVLQFKKRATKR